MLRQETGGIPLVPPVYHRDFIGRKTERDQKARQRKQRRVFLAFLGHLSAHHLQTAENAQRDVKMHERLNVWVFAADAELASALLPYGCKILCINPRRKNTGLLSPFPSWTPSLFSHLLLPSIQEAHGCFFLFFSPHANAALEPCGSSLPEIDFTHTATPQGCACL